MTGKKRWTKSGAATKKESFSIAEAAAHLEVSNATLRNWIKQGVLSSYKDNDTTRISINELTATKTAIKNGSLDRLNKRANKATASNRGQLYHLFKECQEIDRDYPIFSLIGKICLPINDVLFFLALNQCVANGLIHTQKREPFFNNNPAQPRPQLINFLQDWYNSINNKTYNQETVQQLLHAKLPDATDILGLAYQFSTQTGEKIKSGSYYTPDQIVKQMATDLGDTDKRTLDPCCGSGRFLLALAQKGVPCELLVGADADPLAVKIATINLHLFFKKIAVSPNIFHTDTLKDISSNGSLIQYANRCNGFDLIVSNPPWGKCYTGTISGKPKIFNNPHFKGEPFSNFIAAGWKLLKPNGTLSFVLPESILHVSKHKKIRKFILDSMTISAIHQLGRPFKKVFSNVIRLDLKKESCHEHTIKIHTEETTNSIQQERLRNNHNFCFNISLTPKDEKIIKKIYSQPHTTLKGKAQWALGVVTGNNKKFIASQKLPGYEPIYKGSDIKKNYLKPATSFIHFRPDILQQCAPEKIYRASQKLLYRFISNKLVFALDTSGSLTLNSANILIPDSSLSTDLILTLFNSILYQYLFRKKFSSIKVLRSHLEQLPIPHWDTTELINQEHKQEKIEQIIMKRFNLTEEEIAHIQKNI